MLKINLEIQEIGKLRVTEYSTCPGDPETEYWSVPGDPSRASDKDALSIISHLLLQINTFRFKERGDVYVFQLSVTHLDVFPRIMSFYIKCTSVEYIQHHCRLLLIKIAIDYTFIQW